MAKRSGLGQALWVGGYDISGDVGAVNTATASRNALDVTGIDKEGVERIGGLASGEISFNCWFNEDLAHGALSSLPVSEVMAMYLVGRTAGDPVACLLGKQVNYDWARGADGSLLGTVQVLGHGQPVEWASLLWTSSDLDAGADGAAVDDGASSSNGVVYLEHGGTSSGTVNYTIQQSADGTSNWTTVAATSGTTAKKTERIEVGGTVQRYVRAITSGTFADASFAIALRRL